MKNLLFSFLFLYSIPGFAQSQVYGREENSIKETEQRPDTQIIADIGISNILQMSTYIRIRLAKELCQANVDLSTANQRVDAIGGLLTVIRGSLFPDDSVRKSYDSINAYLEKNIFNPIHSEAIHNLYKNSLNTSLKAQVCQAAQIL